MKKISSKIHKTTLIQTGDLHNPSFFRFNNFLFSSDYSKFDEKKISSKIHKTTLMHPRNASPKDEEEFFMPLSKNNVEKVLMIVFLNGLWCE